MPKNPSQQCRLGTPIAITMGNRSHRYGPCTWPAVIEHIRELTVRAAHRGATATSPSRPVSASAWKAVLNDWYDGQMNQWHSCRAVRTAIRHLPADGPIYSTVALDLKAYARGVC